MRLSSQRHRGLWVMCILAVVSLLAAWPVLAQEPIRIVFLHHSVGHNLIEGGNMRQQLTALGYEFYDHGYNEDGLRLANGTWTGENFDVPDDNTYPDGFAVIFSQPLHDPPDNTFSYLMQYDVIIFKSCFPTSNIGDEAQLADYKSYYLTIRDRIDQYPDKIFIVVTPPPQVPGNTNPQEAKRARAFADWLKSDEYVAGHPNLFTFDLFDLLAGSDNVLRPEYRVDDYDGHPNDVANSTVGPIFVAFIDQAIRSYWGEGAPPAPAQAQSTAPEQAAPPAAGSVTTVIDDFEALSEYWDFNTDRAESTVSCGIDSQAAAHGGAASLRIDYAIAPDGWVDCGRYFGEVQDWSAGQGFSMWMQGEEAGTEGTLMLFSGNPDDPTPFEVGFEVPGEWEQLFFPWTAFERASWASQDGLTALDPSRVTGYAFSLGTGSEVRKGVLWVDDVSLGNERQAAEQAESAGAATEVVGEVETGATETEEGGGGGICPLAAALPLGALGGALIAGQRRFSGRSSGPARR